MIKVKLTYKDLHEKNRLLDELKRTCIVKSISKEYPRSKATDIYIDLELMGKTS